MKVYGPYTRKDYRQHVIIVEDSGLKRTVSYPKYIMEQYCGAPLELNETVDHIDGDVSNNDISNLRVITRIDNINEYRKTLGEGICRGCKKVFVKKLRIQKDCSLKCHDKYWNNK